MLTWRIAYFIVRTLNEHNAGISNSSPSELLCLWFWSSPALTHLLQTITVQTDDHYSAIIPNRCLCAEVEQKHPWALQDPTQNPSAFVTKAIFSPSSSTSHNVENLKERLVGCGAFKHVRSKLTEYYLCSTMPSCWCRRLWKTTLTVSWLCRSTSDGSDSAEGEHYN